MMRWFAEKSQYIWNGLLQVVPITLNHVSLLEIKAFAKKIFEIYGCLNAYRKRFPRVMEEFYYGNDQQDKL